MLGRRVLFLLVRPLLDHFDGFLCDEGSEEEWEYVGGRGGDCRVLGCRVWLSKALARS